MFGSVGSLLLAWRLLHLALIWLAPLLALVALAWLTWKYWPRSTPRPATTPETFEPGIPPAVATIALLFFALGAAAADAPASTPSVSVLSASYNGTVNERVAQLEATIQISAARAGQKIPLFGDDIAVEQFSAKPADAKLVREGTRVAVVLPRRGVATLHFKLLVKLGGDVTKRQLAFLIPAALSSQLAVTIDQPEADVEFPTAISFKRATARQQTRVEAIIGSGERVELRWTPRMKRAAEIAANVI